MAFTFDDLRKKVLDERTLNTAFFAETIVYRRENCPDKSLPAHCKHGIRYTIGEDGQEMAVEQLTVTISKEDVTTEPRRGDRVYRTGETSPYIYAYSGKAEKHFWRFVFERRRVLTQG